MMLRELLTLRLAAPLEYGIRDIQPAHSYTELATAFLPHEEGDETVLFYVQEALMLNDASEGPRIRAVPEGHLTAGQSLYRHNSIFDKYLRSNSESGPTECPPRGTLEIAAGTYAFFQWRPKDAQEFEAGLEHFARELWWERRSAHGPWVLRRVAEDGKLATQLLVKLAGE